MAVLLLVLFRQPATINKCPQQTAVVVRHSQLASFTKQNLGSHGIFVFFILIRAGSKKPNKLVYKVFLMAKSGPGIMISFDISLKNMVVVIAQTMK
jgi:hypothetical protein